MEISSSTKGLMASDVVYLLGDSFVAEAQQGRWGGYQAALGRLPLGFSPQNKSDRLLAHLLLLAAFAALEKGGWAEVCAVEKRFILFGGSTLGVRTGPAARDSLAGLEAAIAAKMDARVGQNNDSHRLLNRVMFEFPLHAKFADRDLKIIQITREHLLETGHLHMVDDPAARGLGGLLHTSQKAEAAPGLVAALSGEAERVRALLDERRAADVRLWEDLRSNLWWMLAERDRDLRSPGD